MAKSVHLFTREYRYQEREGMHGYSLCSDSSEDNIHIELSRRAIHVADNGGIPYLSKYSWFDGRVLADIEVTKPFAINARDIYNRNVKISVMPKDGLMPKELTDLLIEKGFAEKKII